MKIFYFNINFIIKNYDYLIKKFCNYSDEKNINFFIKFKDKCRKLASIVLQKYLIYFIYYSNFNYSNFNYSNFNFKKIIIIKDKFNKPYIKFNNKIINYNVSHDNNIIIIVYYKNKKIGIDIMKKKQIEINLDKFNPNNNINKTQLWTLIESYTKYLGYGLNIFNKINIIFYDINTSNKKINIISKKILFEDLYYISIVY